jgi:hypothetical protein
MSYGSEVSRCISVRYTSVLKPRCRAGSTPVCWRNNGFNSLPEDQQLWLNAFVIFLRYPEQIPI